MPRRRKPSGAMGFLAVVWPRSPEHFQVLGRTMIDRSCLKTVR